MSGQTPTLPVLILGAGISGLTLAQGLLKHQIPFRLFERDPALNMRSQGYRFRIQGPGVAALRQVLTPSMHAELEQTCAYLGPGPIIHLDAVTGASTDGPKGMHAEQYPPLNVDRTMMRSVLFQGLESHMEFNREYVGYKITSTGIRVSFADGTSVEGSLLVGADGARSRIKRQLVPNDVLLDTQGRFLFGKTALTPEVSESFNKQALQGMSVVRDQSQAIPLSLLLEPMHFTKSAETTVPPPDDYIYWVLIAHVDRFGMDDAKLLKLPSGEAANLAEVLTSKWDPSFQSLLAHQSRDQTAMLRIASSSPNLPQWDGEGRVTLIGDAAHAMSPTAGAGASTAVRDAALLAQVLASDGASVQAIAKYETAMREYAAEPIRKSLIGGRMMFGMQPFEDLKPAVFERA